MRKGKRSGRKEKFQAVAVVVHLEREGEGAMLHGYMGVTMCMRTGAVDTGKKEGGVLLGQPGLSLLQHGNTGKLMGIASSEESVD